MKNVKKGQQKINKTKTKNGCTNTTRCKNNYRCRKKEGHCLTNFLIEKRGGSCKARYCAEGKKQCSVKMGNMRRVIKY